MVDTWSNYALNCLEFDATISCIEALDALTQVADSPMMWIGRALLLESKGRKASDKSKLIAMEKAADAYRAALQVAREPSALLGLAMTCRHRLTASNVHRDKLRHESMSSVYAYQGLKVGSDFFGIMIFGTSILEESFQRDDIRSSSILWNEATEEFEESKKMIDSNQVQYFERNDLKQGYSTPTKTLDPISQLSHFLLSSPRLHSRFKLKNHTTADNDVNFIMKIFIRIRVNLRTGYLLQKL